MLSFLFFVWGGSGGSGGVPAFGGQLFARFGSALYSRLSQLGDPHSGWDSEIH